MIYGAKNTATKKNKQTYTHKNDDDDKKKKKKNTEKEAKKYYDKVNKVNK